jgi:hypothetical protein
MQTSGASRREIANVYLELFWLFENSEAGFRAKRSFRRSTKRTRHART